MLAYFCFIILDMAHIHDEIDYTVTAYIVYSQKVLMVHHKGLNGWLPVGGHVELDEDPEEALFREIWEESGLGKDDLTALTHKPAEKFERCKFLLTPNFLDIHKISESHRHVGLTYVLISSTDKIVHNADEHNEIKWFSSEEIEETEMLANVAFYCREALKLASGESR